MSYFSANYKHLSYPIAEDGVATGFRPAQVAAIQAIGTHFFGHSEPAIVVMPTGSGKSGIICAVPFALRATRVLVLTPSRLVREQLAENFASLVDLHKFGAVPSTLAAPDVRAIQKYMSDAAEWDSLRSADVVIATVPSVSPRPGTVVDPPIDMFDLILVDEAHHSPARTWTALLTHLKTARQVLFTATPFRRDEKNVSGRLVFTYGLKRAHADKVFGDIQYEAVPSKPTEPIDTTIARAAEARLKADHKKGFDHLLMVRADTIIRARVLHEIYKDNTSLRLEFVSGSFSLARIKKIIKKLDSKDADGIVCVNMFGEGFNMPRLKVAAIHSPHKSLSVTLQFIGRFARTGTANVGPATFLAEPHESVEELGELYESGSVWRDIVANLSDSRVDEEIENRNVVESFDVAAAKPDLADFSLFTLRPYCHAKVYRVAEVDLTIEPDFPRGVDIVFEGSSEPRRALVYITRQVTYPVWSDDDRFADVRYDLFLFQHCAKQGLLFVCTSRRRTAHLYERLIEPLTNNSHYPVSAGGINRLLRNLRELAVVNVGLRSRNRLGAVESYQQRTGPRVDRTVHMIDGKRFDRGHLFATATENGEKITIGVSPNGKVWHNQYLKIPKLLQLFEQHARKIADPASVVTDTGLDHLQPGDELATVPDGIVSAAWNFHSYLEPPVVLVADANGVVTEHNFLDFDISILSSVAGRCDFAISTEGLMWTYRFEVGNGKLIQAIDPQAEKLLVVEDGDAIDMSDYLSDAQPTFYRTDLSCVEGTTLYPNRGAGEPFDEGWIDAVDWRRAGIDIESEKEKTASGDSIFSWVIEKARSLGDRLVFCDDNAGEVADFITASCDLASPIVRFFHCKGSGAKKPGGRQADFYEVLGQALRTSVWFDLKRLHDRLDYRRKGKVLGLVAGGEPELAWLKDASISSKVQFEVYVVQPGLAKSKVSPELLELFAGTFSYLHQGGVSRFAVIANSDGGTKEAGTPVFS